MSKFLGLPSATTIADSHPRKLLPSVGAPKASEIATNISTFFGSPSAAIGFSPPPRAGHCLMIDGIHLCQRARWYQPTNQIVGLCREHCGDLDLSMDSMNSVIEVLDAVHGDTPTCHYGREATVGAVGAFRAEHYHGLPILQAQTCKSEKGPGFAVLLESLLDQWKLHGEPHSGPIWVVGTDGDAVFRDGAFKVLMCHKLEPSDPLYVKLASLDGLNLQCSKDKQVQAPDPKHVTKRIATSERSNEGVVIAQVIINRSIITQWLERLPGETKESVAILVDPADHQNVPRAYKLIKASISLGSDAIPPTPDPSPTDESTRRAFSLAGEMWNAFLEPFTNGSLSLSEQLKSLSKFAHLAFVFYRMHGSSFLSNQLYSDLQALVKAAFFCVAQQQILDPEVAFYLYQLGSDRLEEMFAEVRTESHDSNADSLQLAERLSGAADSVQILNEYPEWHQGHVRRSWSGKEADHVNPTFFTGDLIVGHVVLREVWWAGRVAASNFLYSHGIDFDFSEALEDPGTDFLCPNGNNVYPGISREKDRSIIDDVSPIDIPACAAAGETTLDPREDTEPVLPEDDAPTVFLEDFIPEDSEMIPSESSQSIGTPKVLSNDWLEYPLEDGSSKRLHKATVLSTLFNSDYKRLATTRLLRVRCYTDAGHKPALNHTEVSGEFSFNVGDLAVALLRSHNTVAAAVVRVTVLEKNKVRVSQVDVEDLGSPSSQVSVTAQPLILRDTWVVGRQGMPSARKWVWMGDYGKFEPLNGAASTVEAGTRKALTVKIPGALLHPLDAEVENIDVLDMADIETMRAKNFSQTWAVSHSDFDAVVSAMYERLDVLPLLQLLPKHGKSDSFPYKNSRDNSAAFVLEHATQSLAQKMHDDSQKISCFQCHLLIKPDDARAHVGEHILRAMRGVREPLLYEQVRRTLPCGFCGRSGCSVEMVKSGKTFKITSRCARQHPFAYGHAKKYSAATPSTNVPIACVLCDIVPPRKTHPAFWKYCILSHIQSQHPRYWDDLDAAPINLGKEFANTIAISREELNALGISMGLSSAPFAHSLAPSTTRKRGLVLDEITNFMAEAGPSKRRKH
ncbi:hypothetical protein B0H15DRAFT_787927 [Mycena belliarum]|uniref:Uncharacterized protein n=1 Tax=Mycena belliarum TaxID=1033014 RepID=A0AAD6TXB2_9AGAR|nr:hypothetical protein B0H15DRAFT_787927 [Mycena belliae]